MNRVKLIIPSDSYHIGQIVTGFLMLREQGWEVRLENRSRRRDNPFYGLPVALAEYEGRTLFYDLWDGYQNPDGMVLGLQSCDLYFKRSFDEDRNRLLFPEHADKMRPLGFNYHVTCRDNPINEPLWKDAAKRLLGRAPERYFVPGVFECTSEPKAEDARILFMTQLWDTDDPSISRDDNREREQINESRIQILRALRQEFGPRFIGGLNDTNSRLARILAPDLVLERRMTERGKYLRLVHSCNICIGTRGLYDSIGWKTGEYVAAGKAIVNERFRYSPGEGFMEGKNYIGFDTPQECVQAVEALARDPDRLMRMQLDNARYYQTHLRPDRLVLRTLEQAEAVGQRR